MTSRIFLAALALMPCTVALSEVSCPPVFSDHMVLQRDAPVRVWGTADPGEAITVTFSSHESSTIAADDGTWSVIMKPLRASSVPESLKIEGKHTIVYHDVLVGEVWLCSGQSNMEKPIGEQSGQKPTTDHEKEIVAADHPMIRLFKMPRYGKSETPPEWQVCSPESIQATRFSAAGYFFGATLQPELGVPIGLIQSAFGGTMIETWIPESTFRSNEELRPLLDQEYFSWVEGVQATELYNSMVAPLCPYALRGFLWYQGESNLMEGDSFNYTGKQIALIESWREKWKLPEAPFYFVQLAPFNYSEWTKFPKRQTPLSLPAFWEAQTKVTKHPHTGMVVITDLAGDGKDIHPTRKKEVGQRLARLALLKNYGHSGLIAESPECIEGRYDGNGNYILRFSHVGTGLKSRNGEPLTHFQIAGTSGHFHPATANILSANEIVVRSEAVDKPTAVRFGWDELAMPNLINSAGLPANPFRTDKWPVQVIRSDIGDPSNKE